MPAPFRPAGLAPRPGAAPTASGVVTGSDPQALGQGDMGGFEGACTGAQDGASGRVVGSAHEAPT